MIPLVELQPDAKGVLLAELAEGGAGTCPDASDTQAYSGPGRHSQVLPDRVDVLFLEANDRDPGGPSDLQGLRTILFRHVCEFPEQLRSHHTTGNMGGNRIGLVVPLRNCSFFTQLEHKKPPPLVLGPIKGPSSENLTRISNPGKTP